MHKDDLGGRWSGDDDDEHYDKISCWRSLLRGLEEGSWKEEKILKKCLFRSKICKVVFDVLPKGDKIFGGGKAY